MKNRLIGAVAAATLALAASGCGSTGSGGDTITYAIWDEAQRPAMEQIADKFETANPGTTVEIQLTPNAQYWTKLQTSMSGGNGPDVFWMNGAQFGLYASEGQLAPLDDQGIDQSKYPASLTELYTYEGKLYGAPKDFDTIGLWYNKKLFAEAGVPEPTADWTWQDTREAAKKLTRGDTKGFVAPAYTQENIYTAIPQAGGEVISSDHKKSGYGSPEALAGIEYLLGFIADGSSPTAQQMADTEPETMFTSGQVAMGYFASYAALPFSQSQVGNDINVAPLPKGPTGNQSVIHGLGNVANAKSKNLPMAKKFAAFASSAEAAELQATTGTVIPAYTGTAEKWVQSMPQYRLQTFVDAVPGAVPYPISTRRAEWSKLEAGTFLQIWSGAVPADQGLRQLATGMQAKLDAEQR
ncbi:sugar ABC transporter substrate-binding protein [Enemella evansiae]|uniref:ABC transporter substrate-binding protein n=1 Tax=Enemella evansiae TaxID=2016499 RepID=UPI000B965D84|nr:sugar ABC transporter substrate-binding protein [Enemella evansiae]OYO14942.1 sugar ABC transporter substrate-binding protein [Enemella evansiae]